jgi:hypothetical protein
LRVGGGGRPPTPKTPIPNPHFEIGIKNFLQHQQHKIFKFIKHLIILLYNILKINLKCNYYQLKRKYQRH